MSPVAAAFTSTLSFPTTTTSRTPPIDYRKNQNDPRSCPISPKSTSSSISLSADYTNSPPVPAQPPPAPPTSSNLPTTSRLSSSFSKREPPPALPPLPPLPSIEFLDNNSMTSRGSVSSASSSARKNSYYSYYTSAESPPATPVSASGAGSSGYGSAITTTTELDNSNSQYQESNSSGELSSRPRNKKKLGINTVHGNGAQRNSRVQSLNYPTSPGQSPLNPTFSHPAEVTGSGSGSSSFFDTKPSEIPPVPALPELSDLGTSVFSSSTTGQAPPPLGSNRPPPLPLDLDTTSGGEVPPISPSEPRSARILRPEQSQASVSSSSRVASNPTTSTNNNYFNNNITTTISNTTTATNNTSTNNKLFNSVKTFAASATSSSSNSNQNMVAGTSLMQMGSPAKYYSDDEAKTKLKLLMSSDAKFDEIIEFGFPIIPEKADYELTSSMRKASISTTSDSDNNTDLASPVGSESYNKSWKRISMVPREMTLKITLSPPSMRADEEALYGWQRDHIDTGTIKSTKSLGMVDEDDEDLPVPPHPFHADEPGSPTTSIDNNQSSSSTSMLQAASKKASVKKVFGRFKKQNKEKTPNAAMIITSADME